MHNTTVNKELVLFKAFRMIVTICFCGGLMLPRFFARSNDGNDELPDEVWQLLLFVIWVPLNLSIQYVIDDLLFMKHQQEKNEARLQQCIAETDFWDDALSCPLTLERMKDPVILFCYDRSNFLRTRVRQTSHL